MGSGRALLTYSFFTYLAAHVGKKMKFGLHETG